MNKTHLFKGGLLTLAAALFAPFAQADQTTLTATHRGWYNNDGIYSGEGSGFTVGSSGVNDYRNFFFFDRSLNADLLFAEIHGATLEIKLPDNLFEVGEPNYFSTDLNDTGALYSLYRFEGSRTALLDPSSGIGTSLYADLGTDVGGSFGSRGVSVADNVAGGVISVNLGQYFIDYINSLTGEFVLGGALSNPNDNPLPGDYEFLFGASASLDLQHSITLRIDYTPVPEPSTYGMIGAGLLGLVVWRRRASQKNRR